MRWPAAVTLLVASLARADEGEVSYEPEPLHLVAVRGAPAGERASFTARYTVELPAGGEHDLGLIVLPGGAVATRATAIAGGKHELELIDSDRADQELAAVLALPDGPKRRWAMRIEHAGGPQVAVT